MKKTVAQTLAAEIAKQEHVLSAYAIGRYVTITHPRERGGRITLSTPQAKNYLDRVTSYAESRAARKGNAE